MRNLGSGKWIAIIIVVVGLLVLGVNQFYVHVMAKPWSKEQLAINSAQEKADIVSVARTFNSVWTDSSTYWVVEGKNTAQEDLMVWVKFNIDGSVAEGANAVHVEKTAGTVTYEKANALVQNDLPGAEAVRIVPGSFKGKYAWQVFAKLNERYYYIFYNFRDGAKLGGPMELPATLKGTGQED